MKTVALAVPDGFGRWATVIVVVVALIILVKTGAKIELGAGSAD